VGGVKHPGGHYFQYANHKGKVAPFSFPLASGGEEKEEGRSK